FEDEQRELNERLQILKERCTEKPLISVNFFIKDEKKSGGRYETHVGNAKRFDEVELSIIFTDDTKIPVSDIYSVDGEIFDFLNNEI
ncbi:MAG: hypothetical protein IKT78_04110, partial [Ruminiclostridium sp.]|nr:hypothetical protein [Ruminiclostridium sp.]